MAIDLEFERNSLEQYDKIIKNEKKYSVEEVIARAFKEANDLLVMLFTENKISRNKARELSISERGYYWALGLLRYSGVVERNSTELRIMQYSVARTKLETGRNRLLQEVEPLEYLRMYLPSKMAKRKLVSEMNNND